MNKAVIILALSGILSAPIGVMAAPESPNVIMILIDDMGWSDSAVYGSKYYDTPNLTRLSEQGMRFTDAYAAAPLCSPTRASIMSGQYPARLRMTQALTPKNVPEPMALPPMSNEHCGRVQNRNHMPVEVFTLAEALKEAGYNTAHIGKWHLSPSGKRPDGEASIYDAENQGFDFVIGGAHLPGPPDYYSPYAGRGNRSGIRNLEPGPEGEYLNERLAEESIRWIDSVKDSGKPFYLNFWHYAVHGPVIPKKDLLPKYNERRDPNSDQRCPEMATMLDSMDNSIGMLLDWLDQPENRDLKQNTFIILTSDNGGVIHNQVNGNPWTSNRPLRGGKANTYEGGVREPWIVRWPGRIKPGSVCSTPVQSTDIYPTVLEIAGVKPQVGIQLDGQSILPLLKSEAMQHQPIFTHFPHLFGALCAPSTSVRSGDWKLIRYHHAGVNAASHAYDLFDLRRDPCEAINLAAYLPKKVHQLDRLIESFLKETDALVPIRNANYSGDPQSERTEKGLRKAPKRPRSLRLPETVLKITKGGSRRLQLLDQDNNPRKTHAMVLAGEQWVRVENNPDGSVEVHWDAMPERGAAKVLFGWKGGAIPQEINLATIPPCELLLGSSVQVAPRVGVQDTDASVPAGSADVFSESFDNFDPDRFLTKIPNKNTKVRDGALWTHGESGGKYPPMVYLDVVGKDLEISFRYRHLQDGGMIWFFVDGDDGFGSVDHMLRVKLLRKGIQLQIDSHSLDPNHTDRQNTGRPADKVSGAYRLNKKFPNEPVDLSANVWHAVKLTFQGDTVAISVDSKAWHSVLTHSCFDAAKRKLLWMQNGGKKGIEIDDILVRTK